VIGRRFVYLPTTGSTNDIARDLAEQGEPEGTAVFADEQTRGRGRAGKSAWLTPANTSIALSIVLRPELAPAALAALSMLAAVAVVDAIKAETALVASLKWPNDVLIGGRKVAGILVASALAGTRVRYAVVGIGINGNFRAESLGPLPDAALPPTTLLDERGRPVDRERLLACLLDNLDDSYRRLRIGGVVPVLRQYTDRLGTLGRMVRVLAPEGVTEGVAEDVTLDGALVVRLPDGTRRTFSYGEVTVRGVPRNAPHSDG
jgi:BirA family biotin operon repressor/biotin-[acetyl-CoA-carboxylase] ligase